MIGLIFQFAALALVIVVAGTLLAKSADEIGERTGLGRTLAGFLLLAAATSLPELTINCHAAVIGAADLAVGDMLGSSLFNLLILGVIDLLHRRSVRILSSLSAAHALSAITSIVLTALILLSILLHTEGQFSSDRQLLRMGVGPWAIAVTYMFSLRLIYFDQRLARESTVEEMQSPAISQGTLRWSIASFALGAVIILFCGPLLVRVANNLAEQTGLGGTFVGTTFVALTTSLPEIITTLAAVRMGAYELAAGNIFGSNCFNIAILPFVDFCYEPGPIMQNVESIHAVTATAVIVITSLAAMGLLYRAEKRWLIVEPDALLVVLLSIGALVLLGILNTG